MARALSDINMSTSSSGTDDSSRRIAYFLRNCGNLHYFAALKPYLDYFLEVGIHDNFIVVRQLDTDLGTMPEYAGYAHLFTADSDLDDYDLVLTPTFLRAHERTDRTRAVQIFHGLSDKPFTYQRDFSDYALCLCAGQRQVDRLLRNKSNQDMRWAKIGYPKFDNPPTVPRLFRNKKKTVLYCPTWVKGSLSSIELFLDHPDIAAQIARDYNLVVKPHPNIFNHNRNFYDPSIVDRLKRIPGIKLIRSGNVMPWFAQSDLYLGDISASGYEWLYFNRPMVFLNPQPGVLVPGRNFDSLTFLWQCGPVCDEIQALKRLIDENIRSDGFSEVREAILHYSVLKPRDKKATGRGIEQVKQLLASSAKAGKHV